MIPTLWHDRWDGLGRKAETHGRSRRTLYANVARGHSGSLRAALARGGTEQPPATPEAAPTAMTNLGLLESRDGNRPATTTP
jgi:hypothetical protein